MSSMPRSVRVREVGPRDGFQNEPEVIATDDKIRLIELLGRTGLERTFARARPEGLRCEGVISVSFGCPYEGHVPRERVFEIAARLAAAGCAEVAFGDTTGMANPAQVRDFFAAARE